MEERRPVIKLTPTRLDKNLQLAGMVALFLLWLLSAFAYAKLPEIIPVHFNASGLPDNYGKKATLLVLPLLATLLFLGFSWLSRYPHLFNYITKITAENAKRQYCIATRMLSMLRLEIMLVFLAIQVYTFLVATGKASKLSMWFLPLVFIALLAPVAAGIIQSAKNK